MGGKFLFKRHLLWRPLHIKCVVFFFLLVVLTFVLIFSCRDFH